MSCRVMHDLTDADFAAVGVSNHQILQLSRMTDEQRIRFLGVDVMADVVTFRFAKILQSPQVRKLMKGSIERYLKDREISRRLGHTPVGNQPR